MNKKLSLSLFQQPLVWESPKQNIVYFKGCIKAHLTALSKKQQETHVLVLPEMWSTGFSMALVKNAKEIGNLSLDFMVSTAVSYQVAVTGSTIFKNHTGVFNRLFFVYPDGTHLCYDKRHTFGMAGESKVCQNGATPVVIPYKGFKIFPLICYDLRFPVWARNTHNYDLLLYVANWPAPRIKAWDTLLKARAIENMAYCVGVNRTGKDPNGHIYPGHSGAYDPFGHTLAFSDKTTVLYVTLDKAPLIQARINFPFLQDRDAFSLE